MRILNESINVGLKKECFVMVQFGNNSFISEPQNVDGKEEIKIDTEFTLDITSASATKLIAINLHQMKEGTKKRSKVVGRSAKMGLPRL